MNRSVGTWLWDDVRFFLAVARAEACREPPMEVHHSLLLRYVLLRLLK
jgi:hypothetical protein